MVKELLLAIILGATLGFMVTGSVLGLVKNKSISKVTPLPTPTVTATGTSGPEPTDNTSPTPAPTSSLDISTPEDDSIADTAKITVQGTATPGSIVVIKTEKDNYSGAADTNGNFSIPVELDTGINDLQVASFAKDDTQQEKDITVTYSTAKI